MLLEPSLLNQEEPKLLIYYNNGSKDAFLEVHEKFEKVKKATAEIILSSDGNSCKFDKSWKLKKLIVNFFVFWITSDHHVSFWKASVEL